MVAEVLLNGFSRAFLASLFEYDADSGTLVRKISTSANAKAGAVVGSLDGKGYLHVSIYKRFVRIHRIVYFLHTGEVPKQIDHVDRNRTNNRVENLRPCDEHRNAGNTGMYKHNTSGYRGVSFNTKRRRWCAQIKKFGKQTPLGDFATKEEAALRYNEAAREHFGEFATLNEVVL